MNADLEVKMDDFIVRNIELQNYIENFDTSTNTWVIVPANTRVSPNTKYKLCMRAFNHGSETVYVKNVQFEVEDLACDRVNIFKDDTYLTPINFSSGWIGPPIISSQVYPTVLNPYRSWPMSVATSMAPYTPWYKVPFMVLPGASGQYPIFKIGIYAEIVPKGHYWNEINVPL